MCYHVCLHTHHCTQPILTTAHNPYSPLHTTHTHHCTQPILTTAHNPYSPLHTTHSHHCTQPILTTAHNPYSPLHTTHTHHCTQPILTTAHNPYSPLHTIHGTLFPMQVSVGVKLCLHNLSLSSVPVQSMSVCRKWTSSTLLPCNQCSSACPRPSC